MEQLEQTDNFRRVYQFASETSQSVFLTGKAGSGKTTLLKYIRENCFKQISIVAPTGVAAINAGGTTIHSFFQLPFGPILPPLNKQFPSAESKQLMSSIKLNKNRLTTLRRLDLLIIDEISMVRCDVLDAIDVVLRAVRHQSHLPFGGVQVLMVGDMYQLPPVIKEDEWMLLKEKYNSPFFFDSHVVKEVKPVFIELEKIYRQDEPVFIDLLNKVRNNIIDHDSIDLLNNRFKNENEIGSDAIILTTHNHMADTINARELQNLKGKEFIFKATITGNFSEKSYPAEAELKLKVGAKVMFLRNDSNKRYFNGKTGIVTTLEAERVGISCEGESQEILLIRETWSNIQYRVDKTTNKIEEETLGEFKQFPLRLAWAITIHKSQGLTFDKVVIDAAQAFSSGQVYVALSRCRSLEGIILKSKIQKKSLTNDEKIVSFAATKTPTELVASAFEDEKKKYTQTLLTQLFSLNELEAEYGFLERKFIEHKSKFIISDYGWLSAQTEMLNALKQVSLKFQNELIQLFTSTTKAEIIDARLNKASIYFTGKLEELLARLKQCAWVSESIQVSKEITEVLDEIYSLLSFKSYMMKACNDRFNLHAYTKRRQEFRLSEFKFKIYVAEKRQVVSTDIPHPALYAALQEVRDAICDAQNKPVYLVANRNSLKAMCEYLPTNANELLKINGFGKVKVESIGNRFLNIINEYLEQQGIESCMHLLEKLAKPKEKPGLAKSYTGDTAQKSFELFKSGKTVSEIAKIRNLAMGTIETHLVQFVGSGDIKLEGFLDAAKINELESVLKAHPTYTSLTELKQFCSEKITFIDLRAFLVARKSTAEAKL